MRLLKIFLFIMSTFVLFDLAFAYIHTITHNGAEGAELYYCSNPPSTSDVCVSNTGNLISSDYSGSPFSLNFYDLSSNYFKKYYTFKQDKRIVFGFGSNAEGTNYYDSRLNDYNAYFTPYLTPQVIALGGIYAGGYNFDNKDLQGNICNIPTLSFDSHSNKLTLTPSLNPITKITSNTQYAIPEHLLDDYYYMKSFAIAKLSKLDETTSTWGLVPGNYDILPLESTTSLTYDGKKYVILEPSSNELNFNLPNSAESLINFYPELDQGNYKWEISVTPIDMKCDLNSNGVLSPGSEYQGAYTFSSIITIENPEPELIINSNNKISQYGLDLEISINNLNSAAICKVRSTSGELFTTFDLTHSNPNQFVNLEYGMFADDSTQIYLTCNIDSNDYRTDSFIVEKDYDLDNVLDYQDNCKIVPGIHNGCPLI